MADHFQTVALQQDWGLLSVEINFIGVDLGEYELVLWTSDSDTQLFDYKGTNKNPAKYDMPFPNDLNKGRRLRCRIFVTTLLNDPGISHSASMKLFKAGSTDPLCEVKDEYSFQDNDHIQGNLVIDFV